MRLLTREETLEKVAALEAASELGKILSHKWHDHIAGGLADKRSPADFPREDLIKGMAVEMEHSGDPSVACEIAMDHLTEDPHYYDHKQDMAAEVRDKLGHVIPRVDGAVTAAEKLGGLMASMEKAALLNPLKLFRGGTKATGSLGKVVSPKITNLGATVAERGGAGIRASKAPATLIDRKTIDATGNTLFDGSRSLSPRTIVDPQAAAPASSLVKNKAGTPGSKVTGRYGTSQLPVNRQPTEVERRLNEVLGAPRTRMDTVTHEARKAEIMATPAPPGYGHATPSVVQRNMAQQAAQQPATVYPAVANRTVGPGTVAPATASPGVVGKNPATQAAVAKGGPELASSDWMNKLDQDVGPMSRPAKPLHPKVQKNLERVRAQKATEAATSDVQRSGASFGGRTGKVQPNTTNTNMSGPPASTRGPSGGSGSPTQGPVSSSPDVKRFGMGKALGYGALAGAGYGLYKGVPWAAEKIDENLSTPKAFNDYYRSTPYGYGPNPYGDGTVNMGYG